MNKIDKKRKKIIERIQFLERDMQTNLRQKVSSTEEIKISDYQRKIAELRKQLDLIA